MKTLKLYLAHNIENRHEFRKKELELESKYNIKLFNPFYDCSQRKDIKKLDDLNIVHRTQMDKPFSIKHCKNIVKRDLSSLTKQDGVLAIIYKASIGTTLEIGYAKCKHKKIFIITDNYYNHPWVRVYADYLFISIKDFMIWLDKHGYRK